MTRYHDIQTRWADGRPGAAAVPRNETADPSLLGNAPGLIAGSLPLQTPVLCLGLAEVAETAGI